jgi:hypothetical protein
MLPALPLIDSPLPMMKSNVLSSATTAKPVLHRTFFPETWLWNLERIGESRQKDIPVTLPHTITEWVGNGFCVNTKSSIGVSEPFKITAFQPFFMSFTLPYSMVRGESVDIPVSVFSYLASGCLLVTVAVERNVAFDLVGNSSTQLTVCARTTETFSFRIVPRQIGRLNFTVQASSVPAFTSAESNTIENPEVATAEDKVTRQLLVLSEGKEEEYTRSVYVCSSSEKASSGSWSLTLPDDVIVDSVRTRINVIGDVMGPALSGLDNLLRLPMGCGEQNMLLFAPNIYVLEYLTNTDQLTPSLREKALGFMRTGYQRELTYRHTDGSYSAFGQSDSEGSIWLTSFVIRSFARARPFIFIDNNDLEMSIKWIRSHQLENGCFRSVGKVLHKEMKGGLHGESEIGLTAYIVISLLEANVSSSDPAIENAMRCLSMQSVNDTYTLSLLAYAFDLYGQDVGGAHRIHSQLEFKVTQQGGMTHWSESSGTSPTVSTNSMYDTPKCADVEMTSYILLGMLQVMNQSSVSTAIPIVRWLTTQRNPYGGFTSTQDTVVALQALSQFATLVYSAQRDGDVIITVRGHGLSKSPRGFTVNVANRLVQQTIYNELNLPTTLEYSVTGSGCSLVQVGVRYNKLIVPSDQPRPAFTLNVHVSETNSCKIRKLDLCARYHGEDNKSNMAVVAINMISGWIPDKDSIYKLKNNARLGLKRFDIDKNIVQLYFDEFDTNEKCWSLKIIQAIEVSETRPAIVSVYDYYEPASSVFVEYNIVSERCPNIKAAAVYSAPSGGEALRAGTRRPTVRQQTTRRPQKRRGQATAALCPTCNNSTANNTSQLVCNSSYAYRMRVKKPSTLQLLMTLHSVDDSIQHNITTVKFSLHPRCTCPLLSLTGHRLLVLTPTGLELDQKNRRHLVVNLRSPRVKVLPDSVIRCP